MPLVNMFGARRRTGDASDHIESPSWFKRYITPLLRGVSAAACSHPIQTIVLCAVLASTTYLGLLENSLFSGTTTAADNGGKWDIHSRESYQNILAGSKRLRTSEDTNWKWAIEEGEYGSVGNVGFLRVHGGEGTVVLTGEIVLAGFGYHYPDVS